MRRRAAKSAVPDDPPFLSRVRPTDVIDVFGPPALTARDDRIELKQRLLEARGDYLSGDWDLPADRSFTELEVFDALEARISRDEPWEGTPFYDRVMRDLDRGRRKWGCSTVDEFRDRCAEIDRLWRTIERSGYQTQEELGTGRVDDEIRIGIQRDGRLLFVDGRHRLATAIVLGLDEVPVRITARHRDWGRFKVGILQYAGAHHGRVYQRIDHPDLSYLPSNHGDDRIDMIRGALADVARPAALLDVGTHWGHMCQELQREGFDCTGVERSKESADVARGLSVATRSGYAVWTGSIFDHPDPQRYDVVLALSIFHHFLKTEADYGRLIEFLQRLDAHTMIFEPHRHDPPAQMEGAYRNFPAEDFVRFVAEHSRLPDVALLGHAQNGRPVYRLSR